MILDPKCYFVMPHLYNIYYKDRRHSSKKSASPMTDSAADPQETASKRIWAEMIYDAYQELMWRTVAEALAQNYSELSTFEICKMTGQCVSAGNFGAYKSYKTKGVIPNFKLDEGCYLMTDHRGFEDVVDFLSSSAVAAMIHPATSSDIIEHAVHDGLTLYRTYEVSGKMPKFELKRVFPERSRGTDERMY